MKGIESKKLFNTRMLIGTDVTVVTKVPGLVIHGTFFEYFEKNDTVVLRNYEIYRLEEGEWELEDKGDLILIKGDGWVEIKARRFKI